METVKKRRWIMLAVDGGILVLALLITPLARLMIDYLPDCYYARLGLTCPSCGATRCFRAFFSGHFAEAFRFHPFFFCLFFYLGLALLLLNLGYLIPQRHCQRLGNAMISPWAMIILGAIFLTFGLIRMFLLLIL